ncbi:MAG TPA: hypothetical protein PLM63_03825 [bacterium]|jgi:regulator of replication initiation timing|nr:hypothetical protein [bacterium]
MLEKLKKKQELVEKNFDILGEKLKEKKVEIDEIQKEINEIIDEQKRLQGEYRAVKSLIDEMSISEESKNGDIVIG